MSLNLNLTPSGQLTLIESGTDIGFVDKWTSHISEAFSSSSEEGLFALAAAKATQPLSPTLAYWREFSSKYLIKLIRIPGTDSAKITAILPPSEAELSTTLLSAPPMQGGEYLSIEVLTLLWQKLDAWVVTSIHESKTELSVWLGTHAPIWQQVGRVCFHLAENKGDVDLPFAFMATYSPKLSTSGQVQYKPLGRALQEYAGDKNKAALLKLLSPVFNASEKLEFIREMIQSGDIYHPIAWSSREAYQFFKNIPVFEESGLLVRVPNWWRKPPRPQVQVSIGDENISRLGSDALLDFKIDVVLEGEMLSKAELDELLQSDEGLVLIRGKWVEVSGEKLKEALQHWRKVEKDAAEDGISFIEGMRMLAGAPVDLGSGVGKIETDRLWTEIKAGAWLSNTLASLRNPENVKSSIDLDHFQGILRPYQETGFQWLYLLSGLGLGACLADDMGLGKTVQMLALLTALKNEGKTDAFPSLLVLPASLLANWKAEIERFSPSLTTRFIHTSETEKETLLKIANNPSDELSGVDLVLTTYGMLHRQPWLKELEWQLIILDEAQAIKNPGTRQTRAVKQLKSNARVALTGTPVENRMADLWSLFDFLCPGLLGSHRKFKGFVKNLESRMEDRYAPLRRLVSPYILRRLKSDKSIVPDLPDKTEVKTFCGLTKKQVALYSKSVDELKYGLQNKDGIDRRGLVLKYLIRFKQICNHPSQLLGDRDYNGVDSGKFARLQSISEEIFSRQEKMLIFTQFREMTNPIADFLEEEFGVRGLILHGGTAVKQRKILVDKFQNDSGFPFFVLSLKAGGTGLNLTAAAHVIHFDRWWNPAVENQATDRAYRIGQHKNVLVHKFMTRGTIEENIDVLIEDKKQLSDGILNTGAETILTEMSDEELLNVVALDINRAEL
ncbi:DEAD/DEAH box helicase [bacterium]|nr:DEAD/DEAH box helicase [bacterium]